MIRNIDPSGEAFLAQVERIQRRLEHAQSEMASGRRVSAPSDDPDQVSAILQLRSEIERNAQIRTNLVRAQSEANTADSVLARAVQVLDRAIAMATEGATATSTAERRVTLAGQVGGLLEDMVGHSQAVVEGRFLFGGDDDRTPPYTLNLAAPTGVDQVQAAAATRLVEHPSGTTFVIRKIAAEIFDSRNPDGTPAADNVFAALNGLRVALAGNDAPGISSALSSLHRASEHLSVQEAFYGGAQNRISSALEDAARSDLRLKSALSDLEDSDFTAAVLEFNQAQLSVRAAMSARSQMTRTSLFDFLK